jgi:hypothetical protein
VSTNERRRNRVMDKLWAWVNGPITAHPCFMLFPRIAPSTEAEKAAAKNAAREWQALSRWRR